MRRPAWKGALPETGCLGVDGAGSTYGNLCTIEQHIERAHLTHSYCFTFPCCTRHTVRGWVRELLGAWAGRWVGEWVSEWVDGLVDVNR